MAKKFKDLIIPANGATQSGFGISLLDYIKDYAPDVLNPLPVMEGASALRFWQQTFQPALPGEGKRRLGGGVRWPYAERLVYLAREFAKLDDRSRRYIVKAAAAQIWWRGDGIRQFRSIVEAHLDYRSLSSAERLDYRKRLMHTAQTLAGRHAA